MTTSDRLQELFDKQEIHEVLARFCRGLDRGDYELVRSVFHPDAVHNHGGTVQPVTGLIEALRNPARQMLKAVIHSMGTELIEVRGDVAHSESYFVACHWIEHDGQNWDWIARGRYLDRLERRDGPWLIADRTAVFDWTRVEPAGVPPAGLPLVHSTDDAVWGRPDREDFSYQFPGFS